MKPRTICITDRDAARLHRLLDNSALMQQRPYLETLARELEQAVIVESSGVPPDTITMNSTARLIDLNTDETLTLTLAYPDNADILDGRISVLAPVGTAILGCRAGDVVEWDVPAGVRALRVDCILYQPEAMGDFSL